MPTASSRARVQWASKKRTLRRRWPVYLVMLILGVTTVALVIIIVNNVEGVGKYARDAHTNVDSLADPITQRALNNERTASSTGCPLLDANDMKSTVLGTIAALLVASTSALRAQAMPGMDMSSANGAMSGDPMPMAHMTMTSIGAMHAGDAARAAAIADTLRGAIEKYRDYHVALDDGYTIFLPKIPQKVYHFTSKTNGFKALFTFDPSRPTSLLYRKSSNGYALVGAMYTAPKRYSLEQLNERVPVSVAEWHLHTNLCRPPEGQEQAVLPAGATPSRFGLRGTIATKATCDAAGGRFLPTVFGWMVHVSPWEKSPALVWGTHADDDHHGAAGL